MSAPAAERYSEVRDALTRTVFGRTVAEYAQRLEQHEPGYAELAERICELAWTAAGAFGGEGEGEAATIQRAYVEFVLAYLREYEQFRRTHEYSQAPDRFDEVNATVYQNESYMQSYLLALLTSYAFFPHHFREYLFYRSVVDELAPDARCIELGCGHGLFSVSLLEDSARTCECIDIAPTAVAMTERLLAEHVGEPERYVCITGDATAYQPRLDEYDFAICCGFLEHIPEPHAFLRRLHGLMAEASRIFVMVPVNTPLPDHLIHLEDLGEARELLASGGWSIVREEAIPTEQVSLETALAEQSPVIYLALCARS